MANIIDNQIVFARVLSKIVTVLKEHDNLIKPGATPLDLTSIGGDLDQLEVLAGDMVDPTPEA